MKGKHNGYHMTIYGYVLSGSTSIAHSVFLVGNSSK